MILQNSTLLSLSLSLSLSLACNRRPRPSLKLDEPGPLRKGNIWLNIVINWSDLWGRLDLYQFPLVKFPSPNLCWIILWAVRDSLLRPCQIGNSSSFRSTAFQSSPLLLHSNWTVALHHGRASWRSFRFEWSCARTRRDVCVLNH